jgi:arsenite-transporting ATPase
VSQDSSSTLIDSLLQRRILFVGGKGGVGKTTTASALGVLAARRGRRCLLVSTDPAHSLGDLFGTRIGARETSLGDNLLALEIDPDAEADRYTATVKANMRGLVAPAMYGEIDRQMALARLAPGTGEAALLERVADIMAEAPGRYDLVIFDTAPTGHTVRLLSLPEAMAAWTEGLLKHRERSGKLGEVLSRLGGDRKRGQGDDLGQLSDGPEAGGDRRDRIRELLLQRRRKFHRARRLLLDPGTCGFVWVLVPERLPVLETRKALELLDTFDLRVQGLIVNRVLPPEADGRFLEQRRVQEQTHLDDIERHFGGLPRLRLPLLARDITDPQALARLVDLIANET